MISGAITPAFADILTPEALGFVAKLHRKFESRRQELLAARAARQAEFDHGKLPDFLAQTKTIREADWVIAHSDGKARVVVTTHCEYQIACTKAKATEARIRECKGCEVLEVFNSPISEVAQGALVVMVLLAFLAMAHGFKRTIAGSGSRVPRSSGIGSDSRPRGSRSSTFRCTGPSAPGRGCSTSRTWAGCRWAGPTRCASSTASSPTARTA
mgnify:CR=1 FL=1